MADPFDFDDIPEFVPPLALGAGLGALAGLAGNRGFRAVQGATAGLNAFTGLQRNRRLAEQAEQLKQHREFARQQAIEDRRLAEIERQRLKQGRKGATTLLQGLLPEGQRDAFGINAQEVPIPQQIALLGAMQAEQQRQADARAAGFAETPGVSQQLAQKFAETPQSLGDLFPTHPAHPGMTQATPEVQAFLAESGLPFPITTLPVTPPSTPSTQGFQTPQAPATVNLTPGPGEAEQTLPEFVVTDAGVRDLPFVSAEKPLSLAQRKRAQETFTAQQSEARRTERKERDVAALLKMEDVRQRGRRELKTLTFENRAQLAARSGSLRLQLQERSHDFTQRRDTNKFTQREKELAIRNNHVLQQQNERFKALGENAVTLEHLRSAGKDGRQAANIATRFALQAGNQAGTLLGSLLTSQPELAPFVLDQLNDPTTDRLTFDTIKQGLGAYQDNLGTFDAYDQVDAISKIGKSDSVRRSLLLTQADRAIRDGDQERAAIFMKHAENFEKKGQTITVNTGEVGSDRIINRKTFEGLSSVRQGLNLIEQIEPLLENARVSGPAGAFQELQNLFSGTIYDLNLAPSVMEDGSAFQQTMRDFIADPENFFDGTRDAAKILLRGVQYMVARSLDTTGRLSDKEIEAIPLSPSILKPGASLFSALQGVRTLLGNTAIELATRGGSTFNVQPTPELAKNTGEALAMTDPGLTDTELRHIIIDQALDNNVGPTNKYVDNVIRRYRALSR